MIMKACRHNSSEQQVATTSMIQALRNKPLAEPCKKENWPKKNDICKKQSAVYKIICKKRSEYYISRHIHERAIEHLKKCTSALFKQLKKCGNKKSDIDV